MCDWSLLQSKLISNSSVSAGSPHVKKIRFSLRQKGSTAGGRATVALLHLNDAERVVYRLGLIDIAHYPPL